MLHKEPLKMPPTFTEPRNDARFTSVVATLEEQFELLFKRLHWGFNNNVDDAMDKAASRFKKLIESANAPTFDPDGIIPPFVTCYWFEVESWFGFNEHRQKLFADFSKFVNNVKTDNVKRLFLCGSAISNEPFPNDIDVIAVVSKQKHDLESSENPVDRYLYDVFYNEKPVHLILLNHEEDVWGWLYNCRHLTRNGRCQALVDILLR